MTEINDHRPRPYTIIEDVVLDCNLCVYEKMVLICILKYAGKSGQAWPGLKTIAKISSMSDRHVRRTLRQLEELDLLRTETRPGYSSLYHIPEYTLENGKLAGIWEYPPGADQQAAPSGPPVLTPRTNSPPTPDCQSLKHYQRKISKNLSLALPNPSLSKAPENSKPAERDFFDLDLIKAWEREFSIPHQPESPKEMLAMDFMLFAATNKQLLEIKSPLAYLKTITRQGHPINHPSFHERKEKEKQLHKHKILTPTQRWEIINQVHKSMYFIEAREKGVQEDQVEQTAFNLFALEYQKELAGQKMTSSHNTP